jgi:hypothetical protein
MARCAALLLLGAGQLATGNAFVQPGGALFTERPAPRAVSGFEAAEAASFGEATESGISSSKGLFLGLALGLVMGLATAVAPVRAAEAAKPVEAPASCDVRKGCTREQQLAWGKMMAQKYNNYEKGTPPSGKNFTTTDVPGGQQKVDPVELTGGYAGKGLKERLKPFIVDNKAVWKGNVWDNPLWQPGPYTKFK